MTRRNRGALCHVAPMTAAAIFLAASAAAQDATAVVERAERLMWGTTMQADLEMAITTPRWERTLTLKVWIERPRRALVRILSPAKEAGVGSLRIGGEMWNYLPAVERTIKIAPSLMMQSWMGSDFTNDDLVKASNLATDYKHRLTGMDAVDGDPVFVIEAVPKPDAAVVWGRVLLRIRRSDGLPLREEFFDERGTLIRVLSFSDIRLMHGRMIPTRWVMQTIAKPRNSTTIVVRDAAYDRSIADDVFTQRNLQRR